MWTRPRRCWHRIDEDTCQQPARRYAERKRDARSWLALKTWPQELKDTSVVMTKFDIGDGMQGMIGVVGPTRMDYAKVTARLSYFAESLSKAFAEPETKQLPQPNAGELQNLRRYRSGQEGRQRSSPRPQRN